VALSEQPSVAAYARPTPNAEAAAQSVLSLPMDPLMKLSEVELVCDEVTHLW
jgi:dTDP-4-amino-4,6-dideoxygalactose transaminase